MSSPSNTLKCECIDCTCVDCKCKKTESTKRPFYCYYGYYGYALTTLLGLATGYAAGRYVRSKL